MPPKVIGPYRVLDTLGAGGAGTVYRAIDRRSNEKVALKLLSNGPALDPRAARRLAREFETLATLSHPNVVRVFDTGVFQGYPYLAMELVEGLTLRPYLSVSRTENPELAELNGAGSGSHPPSSEQGDSFDSSVRPFSLSAFNEESPSDAAGLGEGGPESLRRLAEVAEEPDTQELDALSLPYELPSSGDVETPPKPPPVSLEEINHPERISKLKDVMVQLCEALCYVHAHGLVHRDLKPSNVMVDEDRIVRLMDFGLAKFLADDRSVTAAGQLVGTFRYMSPEQVLAEPLDGRSDLYSLGVILYEMLSGTTPFDAKTPQELWQRILELDPPPVLSLNPKADPILSRVSVRLMRKEPAERFQTAEELLDALSE
jgi:serine/threonine protein kinase